MDLFLEVSEIEKFIHKELDGYEELLVKLPKTKEEFNERFSLKNDEISIDEVNFEEVNLENYDNFRVRLPKTEKEFKERFGL